MDAHPCSLLCYWDNLLPRICKIHIRGYNAVLCQWYNHYICETRSNYRIFYLSIPQCDLLPLNNSNAVILRCSSAHVSFGYLLRMVNALQRWNDLCRRGPRCANVRGGCGHSRDFPRSRIRLQFLKTQAKTFCSCRCHAQNWSPLYYLCCIIWCLLIINNV